MTPAFWQIVGYTALHSSKICHLRYYLGSYDGNFPSWEGMEHTNIPPDLRTFIWVIWHDMTCCDKMSWMFKMPRRFHELEFNHHFGSYHACINFEKSSSFFRRWEWLNRAEPNSPARFSQGSWYAGRRLQSVWAPKLGMTTGANLCPYGSSFWILMLIRSCQSYTGTYSYIIYIHIFTYTKHIRVHIWYIYIYSYTYTL